MNQELFPPKKRHPASVELVVFGLLAALLMVLAIPLLSRSTSTASDSNPIKLESNK